MYKKNAVHKDLEDIEAQLDQATISESVAQRDTALASARKLAEKVVQSNPDDPSCWYMAGLAFYESFAINEAYGGQTEEYLTRCLILDGNHQFAKLYLGHLYYDTGRFEEALCYFEKITDDYFLSADQKWRVLKLHELILCCKVRLNFPGININDFNFLFQEFDQSPQEDVPIPLEMAVTLAKTKGNPIWERINRKQVLKLFVSFVEKQGIKESLQDYISAF